MEFKVGDKVCIPGRRSTGVICGIYQVDHDEEKLYSVQVVGIKLSLMLVEEYTTPLVVRARGMILYRDLTELERIVYGI